MNSFEVLLGELKAFKEHSITWMEKTDSKLDTLMQLSWKRAGAFAASTTISTVIATIAIEILRKL
jgi:hypothetical protein